MSNKLYNFSQSIVADDHDNVKLVGDIQYPCANYYYGFNSCCQRGYYPLPTVATYTGAGSVCIDSCGHVCLKGDDSLGTQTLSYYGLFCGGDLGYHALPVTGAVCSLCVDSCGHTHLVNDTYSSCLSGAEYYGTCCGGDLGYHTFPSASVCATDSIVSDTNGILSLCNDKQTCQLGNYQYYGTDSMGALGYHTLPSACVGYTNSIGTDYSGNLQLVGDQNSCSIGSNKYYGTDCTNTLGYHALATVVAGYFTGGVNSGSIGSYSGSYVGSYNYLLAEPNCWGAVSFDGGCSYLKVPLYWG